MNVSRERVSGATGDLARLGDRVRVLAGCSWAAHARRGRGRAGDLARPPPHRVPARPRRDRRRRAGDRRPTSSGASSCSRASPTPTSALPRRRCGRGSWATCARSASSWPAPGRSSPRRRARSSTRSCSSARSSAWRLASAEPHCVPAAPAARRRRSSPWASSSSSSRPRRCRSSRSWPGSFLVHEGVQAILRLVYRPPRPGRADPEPEPEPRQEPRPRRRVAVGGGRRGRGRRDRLRVPRRRAASRSPAPPPIATCNGSRALCDRPFDEVVLPATHNSMSVAAAGLVRRRAGARHRRPARGRHPRPAARHALRRPAGQRARPHGLRHARLSCARPIGQDGVSDRSAQAALRLRGRLGFQRRGRARDVPVPHVLRARRHAPGRGPGRPQALPRHAPGRGRRDGEPGLRHARGLRRGHPASGPRAPGVHAPGGRRSGRRCGR